MEKMSAAGQNQPTPYPCLWQVSCQEGHLKRPRAKYVTNTVESTAPVLSMVRPLYFWKLSFKSFVVKEVRDIRLWSNLAKT